MQERGAGHGLLMMPALLRLFMQVYISWAWAFSLPPFGVMRKNALQRWSRAVAAWFLRRLAFLFALIGLRPSSFFFFFSRPPLLPAFPMFIMSSCASAISGNVSGDKLGTPLAGCSCCLISVFRPLSSVLIWRGRKEKEHAIFQVSSPSRILRLATAFRQAAVDRLEKRNIKNLAWQHLMLRWTTWWEWDQTCLGLGGWLPFRFLLTGGTRYSGKLPCKPPTLF